MADSFIRKPGVLASIIVLFAGGVMVILTAIRYRDRQTAEVEHSAPLHELYDVNWDDLPEVRPFSLIGRDGGAFESESLRGEVWIVSYFFSRCPSVCKRQNETIQRLRVKLGDRPVTFVSITCDPDYDRPEILLDYAAKYGAPADDQGWRFLTGSMVDVVRVGKENFQVAVGPETHSTSLMVVDRWGRYRDRIDWEQAPELDRLMKLVDTCVAETEPPAGRTLRTRVAIASAEDEQPRRLVQTTDEVAKLVGDDWRERPWNDRFTLVERNGELVTSESLQGRVWVANFFFTRCPSICKRMMARVDSLHSTLADQGVTFVSITSDSAYDTPVVLAAYARDRGLSLHDRSWLMLVGEPLQTRRVASEFFQAFADGEAHDERLFVIDKWGTVRGSYRYDDDEAMVALRQLVNELRTETEAPAPPTPMPQPQEEEWDDEETPLDGETGDGEADDESSPQDESREDRLSTRVRSDGEAIVLMSCSAAAEWTHGSNRRHVGSFLDSPRVTSVMGESLT